MFVLFFSASTSPLYPDYYGGDSAIFQVIGKEWINGKIPYVNLFDHKGPFIFWVNAIGYKINALFAIQIVFLTCFLMGVYVFMRQTISKVFRWVTVLGTLAVLFIYYTNGNLTEEYCLPFLMWSLTGQYRFFVQKRQKHDPWYALLYGIAFGVCLMTRMTNAVILCAFVFIITICLMINREWNNLLINIIAFIAGVGIVTVPFLVYFARYNAIYDFLYGTFLYNFEYGISETSVFLKQMTIKSLVIAIGTYSTLIGILAVGFFSIKKNRGLAIAMLLAAGLAAYVCFSGQSYEHYAMILVPCFPMVMVELFGIDVRKINLKSIVAVFCVFATFWGVVWTSHIFYENYIKENWGEGISEYAALPISIYQEIPLEERDQVVGYNIVVSTYLNWNLSPCYTYFHHQDWQGGKSQSLMQKIYTEFDSGKAKWIIVPDGECGISKILETKYTLRNQYFVGNEIWNVFSSD